MSDPRVSVVLPTWNGSRFLGEAIESVLAQTYENLELVVVDDASTDETPAIVRAFCEKDPRVVSVRHEQNRKLPAGLNTGFSRARGELLSWTSDDNFYRPTAIAEMVLYLDDHEDVDLVCADYTVQDDRGEDPWVYQVGKTKELLSMSGASVGACFLFRRQMYLNLDGYAEDLFLAEDYDFWLRASISFKLAPLHRDLYVYRRHSESLSSKRLRAQRKAGEEALWRSLNKLPWATAGEKAERCKHLAKQALKRGNLPRASRALLAGVRWKLRQS